MAEAPAWLRSYVHVRGEIISAPLDLPRRFEAVVEALQRAGWVVVVRSIGTDFEGPFGIPVPKSQPLELLLHRGDRPYTAAEAQDALAGALAAVNLTYSALGAWLREIGQEVVAPTIKQATGTGGWVLALAAAGAAVWLIGRVAESSRRQ